MSPYSGSNFFQFFGILFSRLVQFLQGESLQLASDELQLLVLIGIGVGCGSVGVFLVLRKMTMLANALSHTTLLGVVAAYLFSLWLLNSQETVPEALLIACFLMTVLTIGLIHLVQRLLRMQEDASIGLLFTLLFAAGIIAVSTLTKNAHIGTESVMGQIDTLQREDLTMVWWVAIGNLLVIALLHRQYALTTLDKGFAESIGVRPGLYHFLLLLQVAVTTLAAFRAVGILMVLAFLVAPAAAARQLTLGIGRVIALTLILSSFGAFLSVPLTRHLLSQHGLALSTAGVTVFVLMATVFFLIPLQKLVLKVSHR